VFTFIITPNVFASSQVYYYGIDSDNEEKNIKTSGDNNELDKESSNNGS